MEWTEDGLFTYIDSVENKVLEVDFTQESFWSRGGFSGYNPWQDQPNAAPFNQDFYLILNVAAGGTNGYFADNSCSKPWSNSGGTAANDFYDAKDSWYPSWNYPASNDAAMKVKSVKVWSFEDSSKASSRFFGLFR